MKNRKTIKVDRKQLYDEIWTNSLHKTALKYNASEAKFKQACIDADIPLPNLLIILVTSGQCSCNTRPRFLNYPARIPVIGGQRS